MVDIVSPDRLSLVGYVRVSKREEDPRNQEYEITKWAARHGHRIVEVIVDVESGATRLEDREGGRRLLEYLDREDIDGVVVYALDRIARSLGELYGFAQLVERKGKLLVSVREEWLQSLDPSIRRLILSILGWVAEFERKLISERTRAALERRKREGKPLGRPSKFTPSVRARILDMLRRGLTLKEISRQLGLGYSTVKKYVRHDRELREAYIKARYKL